MDLENKIRHALYKEKFNLYAPQKLRVRTVEGKLVPFRFFTEQEYVYSILTKLREKRKPALIRIYKARKRGMSTFFVGDMFHRFQYSDRINWGEIYGHEYAASENLFSILKTFHDNLPPEEQKPIKSDTKKSLLYKDGSRIYVKTVNSRGQSKSGSPDYMLFTEVAKYGDAAGEYLAGVLSGVAMTQFTTVVMESTSFGFDSYWYPKYQESMDVIKKESEKQGIRATHEETLRGITTQFKLLVDGDWPASEYFPIFIPPFWNKENLLPVEKDLEETLNDYEKQIIETYNLPLEFIQWRRFVKQANCQGSEALTKQEYPCSAEESFLSSGRPVFGAEKLDIEIKKVDHRVKLIVKEDLAQITPTNYIKGKLTPLILTYKEGKAPKEVSDNYFIETTKAEVIATPSFKDYSWMEFMPPELDWVDRYCCGVDTAMGLEQGDYDAALMFDRWERKFVAMLLGHFGPSALCREIAKGCTRYNYADVLPESNFTGQALLMPLIYLYPNVMQSSRTIRGIDEVNSLSSYGFNMQGPSKDRVIELFVDYFSRVPEDSDGSYIPFRDLLYQMSTFVKDRGGKMAADGKHHNPGARNYDDLVIAAALTLEADRILSVQGLMPRRKKTVADVAPIPQFARLHNRKPPSHRCL